MVQEQESRSEKAQSMVEFAISFIIILMLLVAVIDFGRAFFTYVALRDAAQEGAFYASICPADLSGIESRARQTSTQPVNLSDASAVDVNCLVSIGGSEYSACTAGGASSLHPGQDMVRVEVVFNNFEITTPLLGSIIGRQSLTLRAEASDHVLRTATTPPTAPCP